MWLLAAMMAWSVFAVGGVYAWGGVPLMVGAAVLAFIGNPTWRTARDTRTLDVLLLGAVVLAAAQLVPIPSGLRALISPHADEARSGLYLGPPAEASWHPLSLSPASTGYALALVVTGLVVFRTVRESQVEGLSRRIIRVVAVVGLLATLAAIAFRPDSGQGLIYGRWHALDKGAHPFGPFVNRDHFATWVLMACPLTAGYVAATTATRRTRRGVSARLVAALDRLGTSTAWVAVAGVVMTMGLLVSTSRSGLIGFAVSLAAGAWLARRRLAGGTFGLRLVGGLAIAAVIAAYVDVQPVISRAEETFAPGAGGRSQVWHETMRVIRDFPVAGTGLGAYRTAMLVYQQSDRSVFINQAHNQYLQFAAEGGALLSGLALLAAIAFVRLVAVRLAHDRSDSAWLRIGGAVAVLAVAVQGVWETGLRIPANGLLFGLAAGVATRRPAEARLASIRSEEQDGG